MSGLFGTLNLGARSLQTQQTGIEVAGHNLANVNNPAYARQRAVIQTSTPVETAIGLKGNGADAVAINQIRDTLLDSQIRTEASVKGSLQAQEEALQYAQANLGQQISSTSSTTSLGKGGLADGLNKFFNAFQELAANPTSQGQRQVVLQQAQDLASQFNQIDSRMSSLRTTMDQSLGVDVTKANQLMKDIAGLNDQISLSEFKTGGAANDLRDLRAQKLEELSTLVKIDTTEQSNGMVDISVAGVALVTGNTQTDTLETYNAGAGQMLVRTVTGQQAITPTSGHMQGVIQARDVELAGLQTNIQNLAAALITQVNTIHAAGFSLTGTTGANFFTGTTAGNMAVNAALLSSPSLIQASGVSGASGDNQVALALAQLGKQAQGTLGTQTFSQYYGQTVASLGQSIANVESEMENQQIVDNMLAKQRQSVMGVSLDEEMTDLVKFQKAFEASARLITTVDEMLTTVIGMKR